MSEARKIRIAVNGYGVIGKRVVDAAMRQDDMELTGVADIATDWRAGVIGAKGIRLFAANNEVAKGMRDAGHDVCVNPLGTAFNPASLARTVQLMASGEMRTERDVRFCEAGVDVEVSALGRLAGGALGASSSESSKSESNDADGSASLAGRSMYEPMPPRGRFAPLMVVCVCV